jgi:hypothetical protein
MNDSLLDWLLVFYATFSNISAIPFFVIYKAGRKPTPYWW